MKDVYVIGGGEQIEAGLAALERDFPNIRSDYDRVLDYLRTKPFGLGTRLDRGDKELTDVSWTNIYHTGSGAAERGAAVLVYEAWMDLNGITVRPLAVIPGSAWSRWDNEQAKSEIRKLL